jgi:histidine ammonia-lyase
VTVVVTGHDLTRDELARVARDGEPVALAPAALEAMAASRAVVDRSLARGDAVYGLTSGVGVLKRAPVDPTAAARYSARLVADHRIALGPPADDAVVRATMLRAANAFASGWMGVRPILAERLVDGLNEGRIPAIPTLGSVGEGDLAQMAELGAWLIDDLAAVGDAPAAGEGLALVTGNAFATARAALAVADAERLLDTIEVAGALSLEALAANPGLLHAAVAESRPYPGIAVTLGRLRGLLAGSFLEDPANARSLQDPLSFRDLPQVQGMCRDVLAHVDAQLAIELNASQANPIVVRSEERIVSVANFEIVPLGAALDYLRIALASSLGTAAERVVKLLEHPWSGLPTGLAAAPDGHGDAGVAVPEAGLSYLAILAQALAVEARSLAAPVSFELVSTTHAEGIEDRTSMAALAARRLDEQLALGRRLVAVELIVAGQAVELRGLAPLGHGTAAVLRRLRHDVAFRRPADPMPDVEAVAAAVAAGAFASD